MSPAPASAADAIVAGSQIIKVRVAELRQLFNAIDPSPFRDRDLDPRAEQFIVEWAGDLPRDEPLALLVHLERAAGPADEAALLGEAIHQYFKQQVASSQRKLRELFRQGRISLVIALAFLSASVAIADALASYFRDIRFAEVLREGFVIGGWVAMWRPLEVFLYDWWPIRAEVRLFERLSTMPVRIEYQETASSGDWRSDWPAVRAAEPRLTRAPGNAGSGLARRATMPSEPTQHQQTPEEEREIREAAPDQTIEDSFPASDPPSSEPNRGDYAALERRRPNDDDVAQRRS
jgi:hypothetical protein